MQVIRNEQTGTVIKSQIDVIIVLIQYGQKITIENKNKKAFLLFTFFCFTF